MRLAVCFPTVRLKQAAETIERWKSAGFMPLIMVNNIPGARFPEGCGAIKKDTYEGYFRECNLLCKILFEEAKADVVVCASDSIFPDPNINATAGGALFATKFPNGVGVMQPVWDRFEGSDGNCWSPWIGRNFWKEFYGGHGPFHHMYFQYFGGRELHDVAAKENVYWETDIIHQHRRPDTKPDWQAKTNKDSYTDRDRTLYYERKSLRFPDYGARSKLFLPEHVGKIILPKDL